jgi:quinol monooxygenase YgiN
MNSEQSPIHAGQMPLHMPVSAQASTIDTRLVRLAHLVIDPQQLDAYRAALREGIEAALRLEPGVLTLYAVSAQADPTRFTLLEIYADQAAYEAHLRSPHFLRYKALTQDMVRSLELVDTVPLLPGTPRLPQRA